MDVYMRGEKNIRKFKSSHQAEMRLNGVWMNVCYRLSGDEMKTFIDGFLSEFLTLYIEK